MRKEQGNGAPWRWGRALGALAAILCAVVLRLPGDGAPRAQTVDTGRNGSEPLYITDIVVEGSRRIEAETVESYLFLAIGDVYDPARVDRSLKALFDTGLFSDVTIRREDATLYVTVVENPIINRVIFEGNDTITSETLQEETQLKPRDVYTKAKVRSDVQRIIELERRAGHFGATVEPKIVELEQNRVDLIYEINEGPPTGVRRINFVGNQAFSDGDLRDVIRTQESKWWNFWTSDDNYDPDRMAFDRELLRQFYLKRGYADFTVVSAVAELTPDQEAFFLTFTINEGPIYDFGEIDIASQIEELDAGKYFRLLRTQPGARYDGEDIDKTIEDLGFAIGLEGFAFADIRPRIRRNLDAGIIDITYVIQQAPRVYVDRINITGNVRTLDKVIRREMRLVEGDAFNAAKLDRSETRINGLGYFSSVEVNQSQGATPDRAVIDVEVAEQATGQLSIGAGFSSAENLIGDISISENNLLGKGQTLRLSASISSQTKRIDFGFTEPWFLDRPLALGFDIFRVEDEFNSGSQFSIVNQGFRVRLGFPLTEFLSAGIRYSLQDERIQDVTPILQFLIPEQSEISSSIGYSLIYDRLDNRITPTQGVVFTLSQDIVGLGGDVHQLRSTAGTSYFYPIAEGWVFNLRTQIGYIDGLGERVNVNDRFFIGEAEVRGFDTFGIGPRTKFSIDPFTGFLTGGDILGGNFFYTGTMEVRFPTPFPPEFGVEGRVFLDMGGLTDVDDDPALVFDDGAPRVSVGVGVTWDSPFGPLQLDIAEVLNKSALDETQAFRFNVGTAF